MKAHSFDWLWAFLGGLLLASMIQFSSLMAKNTTPIFASCITHGVGTLASLFIILLLPFGKNTKNAVQTLSVNEKKPLWSYFGGIPGALTVVLATISVNSALGLSGTLALMLVGQIIFGLISDLFGLFGIPKRALTFNDFFMVLTVITGSGIIIFLRS